jgi:aldehyde:ferredoxin oxidoreductase
MVNGALNFLRIGERIVHVEKAFNRREGLTRKYDTLPKRFWRGLFQRVNRKGRFYIWNHYWINMIRPGGLDVKRGLAPTNKFEELGLDDIMNELGSMGIEPE